MAGVSTRPARLPNREAQSHLGRKVLRPAFAWQDSTAEEHAIAFTVAKMMDEDMLAETQKALQDALAQGTDFATFKARLKPYLMARGWWGKQLMGDPQDGEIKLVQLGSTRRLRTIYHTNLHSAYAAGQWARIERNKKAFPYLKYIPSDAAFPREEHRRFYGMILQLAEEKHGAPFAQKLKDELDALLASPPTAGGHFTDSTSIIREGERLYTRYKDLMDDYINKKRTPPRHPRNHETRGRCHRRRSNRIQQQGRNCRRTDRKPEVLSQSVGGCLQQNGPGTGRRRHPSRLAPDTG